MRHGQTHIWRIMVHFLLGLLSASPGLACPIGLATRANAKAILILILLLLPLQLLSSSIVSSLRFYPDNLTGILFEGHTSEL